MTFEAVEAVVVPVPVFIRQISAVAANGFLAILAGIGVEALIALHAVWIFIPQDVLLPEQRLLAVVAVIALRHLRF